MTQARRRPAEVFPPGDFIAEELEARGWTQGDLARIGRPLQAVNAIIRGKKAITPETAVGLGAAFGTSAEIWLNMENSDRLQRAGPADPDIAERAARLDRGGRDALADYIAAQEPGRARSEMIRLSYILLPRLATFGSVDPLRNLFAMLRDCGYAGVELNLTEPFGIESPSLASIARRFGAGRAVIPDRRGLSGWSLSQLARRVRPGPDGQAVN